MNDRQNPNNLHNPQESVESRVARAAQQLDTAAANYAYRTKTDVDTSAVPSHSRATLADRVTSPRRRFAPFAGIVGAIAFAGSLVFGASVISNQAEKPPTTVPIEVASPSTAPAPTSDFPFVGELRVSLPSASLKSGAEIVTFFNGVATSSFDQRRFTIASAIDIDIDTDGTKELAVLINHDASAEDTTPTVPDPKATKIDGLSKSAPSKLSTKNAASELTKSNSKALDLATAPNSAASSVTSAVAVVRVVNATATTLAATPTFEPRVDGLLMNRRTLWTMRLLDTAVTGSTAVLQRARIDTGAGLISWATAESPIARTAIPLVVEGDKQIRFSTGTSSALVFASSGTRRGWFTAKAGQTLTIATIAMPSSKQRQITLLLKTGSNDQAPVGSGILPGSLTTMLPHGGDYEILVGEGSAESGAETTFELSIK